MLQLGMWYRCYRDCRWLTPAFLTLIDQTQIEMSTDVRLFRGCVLCCLSYTGILLAKDKMDTQIHLTQSFVHSKQIKCLFASVHSACVHVFLLCILFGVWWRGPLGLHHRLLTDQECFLLLHHRKAIKKGLVICSINFWGSVLISSTQ